MRHLVVCCDGTWNRPESRTNIWQIFTLLAERCGQQAVPAGETLELGPCAAPDESTVLAFYQTGVGTEPGERLLGGVFGYGLSRKVALAYAFLCRNWESEDRIYLLGFSRGAFIARSLSGVIGRLGLLPADTPYDAIYRAVRESQEGRPVERGDRFPTIRFLGVFDTVGALGIPVPNLYFLNRWLHLTRFRDTALSPVVEEACQALAIHERRGSFRPVVWSRRPGFVRLPDGSPGVAQRILQVWFAGSHGDVGGGYEDAQDLSDIALYWMLRRLESAGLPLGPDWEKARLAWGDPLGVRHNSEGGLGAVLRAVFRAGPLHWLAPLLDCFAVRPYDRPLVGEIQADDPNLFSVPVGLQIHQSVLERYATGGMPEAVRRALDAKLPVFVERERPETPQARLDGKDVVLLVAERGGREGRGGGRAAAGGEGDVGAPGRTGAPPRARRLASRRSLGSRLRSGRLRRRPAGQAVSTRRPGASWARRAPATTSAAAAARAGARPWPSTRPRATT